MGHIQGMEGLKKKGDWWAETLDLRSIEISEPTVADNWLNMHFEIDTTHKPSGQISKTSEIVFYQVTDGKIVREQFFYDQPSNQQAGTNLKIKDEGNLNSLFSW